MLEGDAGPAADGKPGGRENAGKISRNLEDLVSTRKQTRKGRAANTPDFDVVVVGSGYGGAIAAARLSACRQDGKALSVCVLERGKEYLPGSFPAGLEEIPIHVRYSLYGSDKVVGTRDGLFDFRVNGDMSALVACGLGGGSLINAGVMEKPDPRRFDRRWPQAFRDPQEMAGYYEEAKGLLGAANNTVLDHQRGAPTKFRAHQKFANNNNFRAADITVAMQDKTSSSGVKLNACIYCGDCATGCNFGAKESLDTNLLDLARQQGAELVCGATVSRVEPALLKSGGGHDQRVWKIELNYTDYKLRQRQDEPFVIVARRVVLAAGSFGSTEILMRSRNEGFAVSAKLGSGFSGNGDTLAAVYDQAGKVNAVSRREIEPKERGVGPTITGIIEVDKGADAPPYIIQELAIPNALRQLTGELATTSATLRKLDSIDWSRHRAGAVDPDPCIVDDETMTRTSIVTVFGDDRAEGRLQPGGKYNPEKTEWDKIEDGCLNVSWKNVEYSPLYQDQLDLLESLAAGSENLGTVIPNPLWRFLPDGVEFMVEGGMRGPTATVHPLGGCRMADDPAAGVTDDCGRVFDIDNDGFHEGLVVLDGSIIPGALETNPALTIAAVSLRAIERLISEWNLERIPHEKRERERPFYRDVLLEYAQTGTPPPAPGKSTSLQLVERMAGKLDIRQKPFHLEITLRSLPVSVDRLCRHGGKLIEIDDAQHLLGDDSRIRILEQDTWETLTDGHVKDSDLEAALDKAAVFLATLKGDLTIFDRESTSVLSRWLNALPPWWINRGGRDIYQGIERRFNATGAGSVSGQSANRPLLKSIFRLLKGLFSLGSRAGEIRTMKYDLHLAEVIDAQGEFTGFAEQLKRRGGVSGIKKLSYTRRANPWRQLSEMKLENFPCDAQPMLVLDMKYLARRGVPLLRIVDQRDQPTALVDCAAFLAYVARLVLNIHVWSFRQPDAYSDALVDRSTARKAAIPGVPRPEEIPVVDPRDGSTIARLTRFCDSEDSTPLVVLHGYSIGGSTYTHEAIGTNLVQYFVGRKYDVWILDFRTSSSMGASAGNPWRFEDVAFADIPLAFDRVYKETGKKADVIAHCMGATMLSMALLKTPRQDEAYFDEREQLPRLIESLALSQLGPRMEFSPATIFRAYILSYIHYLLPTRGIAFRRENDEITVAERFYDRLLSTLPYPDNEYDIENPCWPCKKTPFTRTRHRADFVYGRDYSLKNVSPRLLEHMDDFFGYYNIKTLSQVMQFARWKTIATREGYNDYVSRTNLRKRWPDNTCSIHGDENELADISTMQLMFETLQDAGKNYQRFVIENQGHMDCWIGMHASVGLGKIDEFFSKPRRGAASPATNFVAVLPSVGPHIGAPFEDPFSSGENMLPVTVGSSPGMTDSYFIEALAVKRVGNRFVRLDESEVPGSQPAEYLDYLLGRAPFKIFSYSGRENGTNGLGARELRKLAIAENLWRDGADGVLVFFVHHESDDLNDPIFWDRPVAYEDFWMDVSHLLDPRVKILLPGGSEEVDKFQQKLKGLLEDSIVPDIGERIEKSIDEILRKPAQELECAFIPTRSVKPLTSAADGAPEGLCFALASCQFPEGILDREVAFRSYQRLDQRLATEADEADRKIPALDFLLLVGDQVYVDATAGLFDPTALQDRFQRPYQLLFRNRHVQNVMRRLPTFNLLDDHEIDNNWEPISKRDPQQHRDNQDLMIAGRGAFCNWQRKCRSTDMVPQAEEDLWQHFAFKGFPFFLVDSRTRRQHRNLSCIGKASMIDEPQWQALEKWLQDLAGYGGPKFIASPAMPLPRSKLIAESARLPASIRSDGWDGYPASFDCLFGLIRKYDTANVVFLSGDAHLSFVSDIEIGPPAETDDDRQMLRALSIHSSGLYSPYPFANTRREDIAFDDSLSMPVLGRGPAYDITVTTPEKHIVPGDGFCAIEVSRTEKGWDVEAVFDRWDKSVSVSRILPDA